MQKRGNMSRYSAKDYISRDKKEEDMQEQRRLKRKMNKPKRGKN